MFLNEAETNLAWAKNYAATDIEWRYKNDPELRKRQDENIEQQVRKAVEDRNRKVAENVRKEKTSDGTADNATADIAELLGDDFEEEVAKTVAEIKSSRDPLTALRHEKDWLHSVAEAQRAADSTRRANEVRERREAVGGVEDYFPA